MILGALPYALLAGIVPALVWLFFWLREDKLCPEPRALILLSFLGGGISVVIAIFGEKYVADIFEDPSIRYVLWAAIEEVAKLLVISLVALHSACNDEPIDAMIYLITIAIGFSAVENTLFVLDPLQNGDLAGSVAIQSMRFVGASLVHIVSSAIIGFSIGYVFYRNAFAKIFSPILGITAAIALHSLFNLSIINSDTVGTLKAFMWIWLAVVILMILFEEIKAVRPANQI